MSSPIRPSARAQAKNALDQLKELETRAKNQEETLIHVVRATEQVLQKQNQELSSLKEMVNALVGLVGPDEIAKAIDDNRIAAAEENAKQVQANIAKGLENKKLVKAEKVSEQSVIVGQETNADGSVLAPGYSAMSFSEIKPDFQTKLLGQPVGFAVETETGGKFTVTEIIDRVTEVAPTESVTTPAVSQN
jgi:ABC-type transporter Mla subunit MlaD